MFILEYERLAASNYYYMCLPILVHLYIQYELFRHNLDIYWLPGPLDIFSNSQERSTTAVHEKL